MRTVVLDTNVLLAEPNTLLDHPDAEVVIPETVLGEIDKLKTSRVDPELRFRGREVSRLLFELSEQGSLVNGIDLPGGGRLRVAPLDSDVEMPEGLSGRNADDRILAIALQVCEQGCDDVTLVTNDLNMLLKAQTYGLAVERRGDDSQGSFGKRYIVRPFQRYKVQLAILAVALAVFAGVVGVALYASSLVQSSQTTGVPDEFRDQLSPELKSLLDGLMALEKDANDTEALKLVANTYYDLRNATSDMQYAQRALDYYERYLGLVPGDHDARTDAATLYFFTGNTDVAIQEATRVLTEQPDHKQANYNLAIFYWRGRDDYEAAYRQFQKVLEITSPEDVHDAQTREDAIAFMEQILREAEAAGRPIAVDGGSTS